MINLTSSAVICRPVRQVFDFLSMPENDVRWHYGTLAAHTLTEGIPSKGTFFRSIGRSASIHRPVTASNAHLWISYSSDLRNWGGHIQILEARLGGWRDANKIRLSPPLISPTEGRLLIDHGVQHNALVSFSD